MTQTQTTQIGNLTLIAKVSDNYINATELCAKGGKKFPHWNTNKGTENIITSFVEMMYRDLSSPKNRAFYEKVKKSLDASENTGEKIVFMSIGIPTDINVSSGIAFDGEIIAKSNTFSPDDTQIFLGEKRYKIVEVKAHIRKLAMIYEMQGSTDRATWVHPLIAIHIATWVSSDFAIQVSCWVYELLMNGEVRLKNEELRALSGELITTKEQLATIRGQLVSSNGELIITRNKLIDMGERIGDLACRVVPNVQEGEKHNLIIIRMTQDRVYKILHRQEISSSYAMKGQSVVAQFSNVSCGLKYMNKLREHSGYKLTIYYATITINSKPRETEEDDEPEVPFYTEDEFIGMVEEIIQDN